MTIEEQKATARLLERIAQILAKKRVTELERAYALSLADQALLYLQQQEHEL